MKKGFSGWQVLGIVLLAIVVTVGVSYWVLSQYVFVEAFDPVELNTSEQRTLQSKLHVLGVDAQESSSPAVEPEPYSEEGASREVRLSERKLNGMLANNTDLARKLAVDLSQDLLSVVLLVPLEEGFPVLGGQTLRVHAGVELAVNNDRPVVKLKGVSVMGQRVQIIKDGDLQMGTEIVVSEDKTYGTLLGPSPGASVSPEVMLRCLEQLLPSIFKTEDAQQKRKEIFPEDNLETLIHNPERYRAIRDEVNKLLGIVPRDSDRPDPE